MQPSSVIFLVVIAIWAAYLVQHWVGRREHLATARTVDRFSESMRILDRTKAGGDVGSKERVAEVPARVHRNQVTGRSDDATGDLTDFTRGSGRRLADRVVAGARNAASAQNRDAAAESARQVRDRARDLGSKTVGSVAKATSRRDAESLRRPRPAKAPIFGRAPRGVLVVGALVFSVTSLLLAGIGAIGWRWPAFGVLATGLTLWWLRRAVSGEAARRGTLRQAPGSGALRQAPGTGTLRRRPGRAGDKQDRQGRPANGAHLTTPRGGPAGTVGHPQAVNPAGPAGHPGGPSPAPARETNPRSTSGGVVTKGGHTAYGSGARSAVFDLDALNAAAEAAAREELATQGWSPVPVPPPTYTLKAKATYPSLDPDDAEDDVVSPYADVRDLSDYAAERARLASG